MNNAACRELAPTTSRVLVIDDDTMIVRMMCRMLSMYTVVAETDPRLAVDRLEAGEEFDVIVCDLHTPGLSGHEVLTKVNARFKGSQRPSVIVVTGGDTIVDLDTPVDAILTKPFVAAELRTLIAALVSE